jgi:hypothetical protein
MAGWASSYIETRVCGNILCRLSSAAVTPQARNRSLFHSLYTTKARVPYRIIKWIVCLFFILRAGITSALPGDINRDGTVDFDDFFLLADDFGRSGPPVGVADTVFIVRRDTLERIVEVPVLLRDTVYVNLD